MLSRTALQRQFSKTARRAFSTQEAAGIKVVSRDDLSPISEVSVVINAGSRFNTTPGVSHVLKNFAYRNTANRSALRLVRETELLGGNLSASLTRDNIVLTSKFQRKDLPFFVEALGDVVSNTLFAKYELNEDVIPLTLAESKIASKNAAYVSNEAALQAAFHNGLGNPLLAETYSPVSINDVKNYASQAFTKSNITVVGSSVIAKDLASLVEKNFGDLSTGAGLSIPTTKAFAGDVRIKSSGPSALTIAFPNITAVPAYPIIAAALGGSSSVKYSNGNTILSRVAANTGATINTSFTSYGDASVLAITISNASASVTAEAAKSVAFEVRELASVLDIEHIESAANSVRFSTARLADTNAVAALTTRSEKGSTSIDAIMTAGNKVASGTIAIGAVGQVNELPYASDLF